VTLTGEMIVTAARARMGVVYVHQGRTNGQGFDCAGLPVDIGREFGVEVLDIKGYGKVPNPARMRAALDANLDRVPGGRNAMQVGDVAWIRFDKDPQHLAIVGDYKVQPGELTLIHAYNDAGLKQVVEHRIDQAWRNRIVAVWRYRGLAA
jgi:hypothetical protein